MSQRPFRFLHASDLHLDQPAGDIVDPPEHLRDLLIDCPIQAARRVFDAALDHQVEFVVLAGDVIDLHHCGAREVLFLLEEFNRLADRNISVYWCESSTDLAIGKYDGIPWPANVKWCPPGHTQHWHHEIAGAPMCEIFGRSHDGARSPRLNDFSAAASDLFTLAIAHVDWDNNDLSALDIDYWALGGMHQRTTPFASGYLAHYPGTPQGRCFGEAGPHGCTLASVDEHANVRLTPVPTDVVRWQEIAISLGDIGASAVEALLRDRATQLAADTGGVTSILNWKLHCSGVLRAALNHGKISADLTAKLRTEFGHSSTPLWTNAINVELPTNLPDAWLSEDTIRGDFLRAAQRVVSGQRELDESQSSANRADGSQHHRLISQNDMPADYAQRLAWSAGALDRTQSREHLLKEVAWLGADLLSPEEAALGGAGR